MNLQTVFQKFSIIANIKVTDSSIYLPICEDSIAEIQIHLRNDIDAESDLNVHRLETAAATLALYKHTLYTSTSSTNMESFSAGELKIKTNTNSAVKSAFQAWQHAKNSIRDLLIDETFVFERIAY